MPVNPYAEFDDETPAIGQFSPQPSATKKTVAVSPDQPMGRFEPPAPVAAPVQPAAKPVNPYGEFDDAADPVSPVTSSPAPTPAVKNPYGEFDDVNEGDGALSRGLTKAKSSAEFAGKMTTGDYAGAAENIANLNAYNAANPGMVEGDELMQEWQKGDGITGGVKNVAGEIAKDFQEAPTTWEGVKATGRNLKAMGEGVIEQTPNMIAPMAGLLAGGAAGSVVAPGIGTAVGGFAGATAGNTLVEGQGIAMQEMQKAGVDQNNPAAVAKYLEDNSGRLFGKALTKGAIIGAIDTATMGIASKLLTGPAKAAAARALTDMGVDVANRTAVKEAMQAPDFAARLASDSVYQASKTGTNRATRNIGAASLEPAGEFAGEYVGSGVATGDWNEKEAALEAFSSLGQSGATFVGQKAYQAATKPKEAEAPPAGPISKALDAGRQAVGTAPPAVAQPTNLDRIFSDIDWEEQGREALLQNKVRNNTPLTEEEEYRLYGGPPLPGQKPAGQQQPATDDRQGWAATTDPEIVPLESSMEPAEQEEAARKYNLARNTKTKEPQQTDPAVVDNRELQRQQKAGEQISTLYDNSYALEGAPKVDYIPDKEAEAFNQKNLDRLKRKQWQEANKKFAKQQEDDEATVTDAKIPAAVKRQARKQADEIIGADPVYQHMEEAKKRGGLNLEAFKADYDSTSVDQINRRYPGVFSRVGAVTPDEFAAEKGYSTLNDMVQKFAYSRTKRELQAKLVRELNSQWQDAESAMTADMDAEGRKKWTGQAKAALKQPKTTYPASEEDIVNTIGAIQRYPESADEMIDHWSFSPAQKQRLVAARDAAIQKNGGKDGQTQTDAAGQREQANAEGKTSDINIAGAVGKSSEDINAPAENRSPVNKVTTEPPAVGEGRRRSDAPPVSRSQNNTPSASSGATIPSLPERAPQGVSSSQTVSTSGAGGARNASPATKQGEEWKKSVMSIIDKNVFKDIVSQGIQRDGQKVIDLAYKKELSSKDFETLLNISSKYEKDVGRNQGGGGAGPGKVKKARSGAESVWNAVNIVLANSNAPTGLKNSAATSASFSKKSHPAFTLSRINPSVNASGITSWQEGFQRAGLTQDNTQQDVINELQKVIGAKVTAWQLPDNLVAKRASGRLAIQGTPKSDFEAAERLARIFGKKVVWSQITANYRVNGLMVTNNPTLDKHIFIDLRSPLPMHTVFGHELTHHIEKDSPRLFNDIYKAIQPFIKDVAKYQELRQLGKMSEREIRTEIIADFMGDNFADPKFWAAVKAQTGSRWQRVSARIMAWIDNLLGKVTWGATYGSEQFVSDVKAAREILAKGVKEYAGEQEQIADDEAAENLKAWQGDSKIKSIVYHGSPTFGQANNFTFDTNRATGKTVSPGRGLGTFFTEDQLEARAYAGASGAVEPLHLRIENPFEVNSYDLPQFKDIAEAQAFRKRKELQGYDGIHIVDEGHWVIFEAGQAKSADKNGGAYSRENPDIRMSVAQQMGENEEQENETDKTIPRELRNSVASRGRKRELGTEEYAETDFATTGGSVQDSDKEVIGGGVARQSAVKLSAAAPSIPFTGSAPRSFGLVREYLNQPETKARLENIASYLFDKDAAISRVQKEIGPQPEARDYNLLRRLTGKAVSDEIALFDREKLNPLLKEMAEAKVTFDDVGELAWAEHAPERNLQMRRVNARRYIDNLLQQFTDKEKEKYQERLGNIQDEFVMNDQTRNQRRDNFVALLNEMTAEIISTENQVRQQIPQLRQEWQESAENRLEKRLETARKWEEVKGKLSGMTDKEAAAIVKKWQNDPRSAGIRSVVDKMRAINEAALDMNYAAGELTDEEYQAIKGTYKYHVPLYREDMDEGKAPTGRVGIGPLASPIKIAAGSTRAVVDIFPHIVDRYQSAINRKHKLEAGRALYEMVKENPDETRWMLAEQEKKPYADNEGNIRFYTDQVLDQRYETKVKVDGKQYIIAVPKDNKAMVRWMEALNREPVQLGPILKASQKLTRIMAALNTTASPEFLLTNFARDIQTAGIHLEDTAAKGMQKTVLKGIKGAIKGIFLEERQKQSGEWGKAYRDFSKNGGKISYMQGYEDVAELAKSLESELAYAEGKKPKRAKYREFTRFVGAMNTAVENGVRLSTYKALVDSGISPRKAAHTASNLTVDFTRHGTAGPLMNSLWMFSSAGIQGSVRMIKALKNPKVQKIAGGIVAFGFATNIIGAFAGGDDDDGEAYYDKLKRANPSLFERNMIFMIPGTDGKHIKIPMPYGYNTLFVAGNEMAGALRGGSPVDSMGRVASALMGSFNPLGSATILQTIMPTVFDPVAQVMENKSWNGQALMPESNPFGIDKPDSERYFKSVNPIARFATRMINDLTGGSEVKAGLIDVSPETVEMLVETFTGSLGKLAKDTLSLPISAATGDLELHKVPFARKVFGGKSDYVDASLYRENRDTIKQFEKEYEVAEGAEKLAMRSDGKYQLISTTKDVESRLKRTRKRLENAKSRGNDGMAERLEEQMNTIYSDYNRKYNRIFS